MSFSSDYYKNLESKIPTGKIRTRFAPSPTGYMHLGGLRTALYSYLLAKKHGGDFILRIEDTDQERLVEDATDFICRTLKDAGIFYNEGPDIGGPVEPYIQSERQEIYLSYIALLIDRGEAYHCFCDKKILDEQRSIHKASRIPHKYDGRCALLSNDEVKNKLTSGTPYVVRQKMPREGSTYFDDIIFGRIEVDNATLDDTILLKSDGMPTYNFANVVDDHLMGITHIIRGSEFLSSTPKYNLLYKSFGWEPPLFVHVSPIMRDANHKLSKRHGDAYFGDFIEKGYLVEAIINFIALLGWSPGGEEVKFTIEELIAAFDLKGISKDPSIFDYKNLNALNGSYIRAMSDHDFHAAALPYIKKGVKRDINTFYIARILKERCEILSEIPELLDFVDDLPDYDPELYTHKKMSTNPENAKESLTQTLPVLESLSDWNHESVHERLIQLINDLGVKNGWILFPLRVALSGKTFTPGGGIEICVLLGKSETIKRLNTAIKLLDEYNAKPQKSINDSKNLPVVKKEQDKPIKESEISTIMETIPFVNNEIEPTLTQRTKRLSPPCCFGSDRETAEAVSYSIIKPLTNTNEINRIAALAKLDMKNNTEKISSSIQPMMEILDRLLGMEFPNEDDPLDMSLVNVFREDVSRQPKKRDEILYERERLLANAHEVEAGCISVPKVLGRDS